MGRSVISLRPLSTLVAFGLVVLSVPVRPATAQEPVAIAAITVTLVPPPGFKPSTRFTGVENPETGAQLVIQELPLEAYDQVSKMFVDLETARRSFPGQLTIGAWTEVETASGRVPLLAGEQIVGKFTLKKWMALLHGEKTVMLVAQALPDKGLDEAMVVAAIKTVKLGPSQPIAERVALLPYKVEPVAPYRFADFVAGYSTLLVVGPKDADPTGNMPTIVVSPISGAAANRGRLDALAEEFLRGSLQAEGITIDKRSSAAFAGADGIRLEGGFEKKELKKRFVQYLSAPAGDVFMQLIADANEDAFDGLLPAIEKVAASVALKASP